MFCQDLVVRLRAPVGAIPLQIRARHDRVRVGEILDQLPWHRHPGGSKRLGPPAATIRWKGHTSRAAIRETPTAVPLVWSNEQ